MIREGIVEQKIISIFIKGGVNRVSPGEKKINMAVGLFLLTTLLSGKFLLPAKTGLSAADSDLL